MAHSTLEETGADSSYLTICKIYGQVKSGLKPFQIAESEQWDWKLNLSLENTDISM